MPTDTNVSNLIINVLDEQQYEQIQNPSRTELYLVPEVVDTVPTENSTNTVTSGGVYDAINNAKKVYWCYWDDDNNTVTGLTPEQIYQLTQDGCIVKCKMTNTSGDDYIFTLQRCTFSQSNYEIIFSQCADVNTRYVNSYTIRYENNAWAYIEAVYNVQADWNQSLPSEPDYIKNKPTIPTVRTMNHEQLTDSTLGDINIHDGYYFPNAVQDYDGNWYGAVVIGDQVWLGENLRTTKYKDSNNQIIDIPQYTSQTSGLYYFNDENSAFPLKKRGYYYNSPVENAITDVNWRISTDEDWVRLIQYIACQKRYRLVDPNHYIDSNVLYNEYDQTSNRYISTNVEAVALASNEGWVQSQTSYGPGYSPEINNTTGLCLLPLGYAVNSSPIGNFIYVGEQAYYTVPMASDITRRAAVILFYNDSRVHLVLNISSYSPCRYVSDLTPVQFRNWYVGQYGSMQHNLSDTFDLTNFNNADWNYVFNL